MNAARESRVSRWDPETLGGDHHDHADSGDERRLPTLRSARESIRHLLRAYADDIVVDATGLRIYRTRPRYPDTLFTVDDVITRLVALGVAGESIRVSLNQRDPGGRVFYGIEVDQAGAAHLATIYPQLAEAMRTSRLAELGRLRGYWLSSTRRMWSAGKVLM